MKHTTQTLAALVMSAMMLITAAASAQQFVVSGLAYNVLSETEHTVELIMKWSGTTYHGNINIPPTVTYGGVTYDVVALGESAFYYSSVSSVTIPSSVTRIKRGCFLYCTGPYSITIPASVTEIDPLALAARNMYIINVDEGNPNYCAIDGMLFSKDSTTLVECPLGKGGQIVLPQNTQHIGRLAFGHCQGISGITLHEGLRSIGYGAFQYNIQLDSVVIPATVSSLGTNLFDGCTSLSTLSIASGNSNYYMDGMMIYSAGGDTLVSCHKSADTLFLPATLRVVGGMGGNTDIRYVHIPDGVTMIDENAFENSTLASIDLPDSMRIIGEYAFYACMELTRVGMPTWLDTMGSGCFGHCMKLKSITIPNGLRTVPNSAFFSDTALSHITWGDAVEVIDSFAFGATAFVELQLPVTLRSIRCGAFNGYYDGTLRRIVFSAPVDTIEAETFTGHNIESLRLMNDEPPTSLTTLDYGTDYGCLVDATVDSIIIPCGSLNAYTTDSYWGLFNGKYFENCNRIDATTGYSVTIYPNPATDRIGIAGAAGYYRVEIVNLFGQPVISQDVAGGTAAIDVGRLARGTYFLRIHTINGVTTRKVTLQ